MNERRIPGVRSCKGCPDRREGCARDCEDLAIRRVIEACAATEKAAQVKLLDDLGAIKHRNIARAAHRRRNKK